MTVAAHDLGHLTLRLLIVLVIIGAAYGYEYACGDTRRANRAIRRARAAAEKDMSRLEAMPWKEAA